MSRSYSLALALFALCVPYAGAQNATAPAPAPLARPEIEKIVQEYILAHPEVIIDSVRKFQERERAAQQERSKDATRQKVAELTSGPADGPANAAVTIVEFFDYRCRYCKQVAPMLKKLVGEESNHLRIVLKEFPILGPDSLVASKAALAAGKQDAYLKFHDAIWAETGPINQASLEALAGKLSLDVAKFKADMESADVKADIEKTRKLAEAIGVEATPAFVIGGELISGALSEEEFRKKIAALQAKP